MKITRRTKHTLISMDGLTKDIPAPVTDWYETRVLVAGKLVPRRYHLDLHMTLLFANGNAERVYYVEV